MLIDRILNVSVPGIMLICAAQIMADFHAVLMNLSANSRHEIKLLVYPAISDFEQPFYLKIELIFLFQIADTVSIFQNDRFTFANYRKMMWKGEGMGWGVHTFRVAPLITVKF